MIVDAEGSVCGRGRRRQRLWPWMQKAAAVAVDVEGSRWSPSHLRSCSRMSEWCVSIATTSVPCGRTPFRWLVPGWRPEGTAMLPVSCQTQTDQGLADYRNAFLFWPEKSSRGHKISFLRMEDFRKDFLRITVVSPSTILSPVVIDNSSTKYSFNF